jgi:NAD(P) transhydrogenase subunit alpha
MGALAGQRAVLEAASVLQRPLGAVFSAAGKLAPAKVLIIGAGVAGLAAIGTAKALGAQVRAFDTRLAAKDDVKSLGAEFLELDFKESGEGQGGYAKPMSDAFIAAEKALFAQQATEVDVVITTALVPGNKAPILWTADHVGAMRPGTVVVDLAAAQGGNCELTKADEVIAHPNANGTVTLLGPTDLASRMAQTASELFAKNVLNLLAELAPKSAAGTPPGTIDVRNDHEIGGPMIVLLRGEAPPPKVAAPPTPAPAPSPRQSEPEPPRVAHPSVGADAAPSKPKTQYVPAHPALGKLSHPRPKRLRTLIFASLGLVLVLAWLYLRYATGGTTPMRLEVERFVDQLAVFVLACFVGWQIIWNVTPALHTPLMSVTNAISGIILVGGLLEGGHAGSLDTRSILGILAVLLATINIAGGFWVTHRMLRMFRKQG